MSTHLTNSGAGGIPMGVGWHQLFLQHDRQGTIARAGKRQRTVIGAHSLAHTLHRMIEAVSMDATRAASLVPQLWEGLWLACGGASTCRRCDTSKAVGASSVTASPFLVQHRTASSSATAVFRCLAEVLRLCPCGVGVLRRLLLPCRQCACAEVPCARPSCRGGRLWRPTCSKCGTMFTPSPLPVPGKLESLLVRSGPGGLAATAERVVVGWVVSACLLGEKNLESPPVQTVTKDASLAARAGSLPLLSRDARAASRRCVRQMLLSTAAWARNHMFVHRAPAGGLCLAQELCNGMGHHLDTARVLLALAAWAAAPAHVVALARAGLGRLKRLSSARRCAEGRRISAISRPQMAIAHLALGVVGRSDVVPPADFVAILLDGVRWAHYEIAQAVRHASLARVSRPNRSTLPCGCWCNIDGHVVDMCPPHALLGAAGMTVALYHQAPVGLLEPGEDVVGAIRSILDLVGPRKGGLLPTVHSIPTCVSDHLERLGACGMVKEAPISEPHTAAPSAQWTVDAWFAPFDSALSSLGTLDLSGVTCPRGCQQCQHVLGAVDVDSLTTTDGEDEEDGTWAEQFLPLEVRCTTGEYVAADVYLSFVWQALRIIFSFLRPRDLTRCLGVCRDWRNLGRESELWRHFYEKRWKKKVQCLHPASFQVP